ncbi:MAG: ABC transporter permease [Planctomycetota bacterium]|nr:ABC transporter permease [Planctomycetota bacterium]
MKPFLRKYGPLLCLVGLIAFFAVLNPRFLLPHNLRVIAMHSVEVALPALGMTFVVIAAGIDVSIGSVAALCAVAGAWLCRAGLDPVSATLLATSLGGFVGLCNGLLVTRFRIVSFLATLGTMGIARGAAKWLADNQKIDADPGVLRDLVRIVPEPAWFGVGYAVWLLLAIGGLLALLLRRTVFGLHVVAVGSNADNARLCGVAVERTLLIVFLLCGLCAGLTGVLYSFGNLGAGVPTACSGLELKVIAAVVIGGGSLAGGEGSLAGSVFGAVLMAALAHGCTLSGVPDYVQNILVGAIIIIAVAADRLRRH